MMVLSPAMLEVAFGGDVVCLTSDVEVGWRRCWRCSVGKAVDSGKTSSRRWRVVGACEEQQPDVAEGTRLARTWHRRRSLDVEQSRCASAVGLEVKKQRLLSSCHHFIPTPRHLDPSPPRCSATTTTTIPSPCTKK